MVAPRALVNPRLARAGRRTLAAISFVTLVLSLHPATASAACTGCAKPSFGQSALPFPVFQVAAVGDFNGDGIADVATSSLDGQYTNKTATIHLYLGSPGGTMVLASSTDLDGVYELAIAAGDFNRDGKLDLVVVRRQVDGQSVTAQILCFRGDGAGGLLPALAGASGDFSGFFAVLDVEGDGWLDLAVASEDQVLVYRGVGDGTFSGPAAIALDASVSAIVAGDVDSDGRTDLVVATQTSLAVLRNEEGGFATVFETHDVALWPGALALGDVDGDGVLDLVVGSTGGGLGVLYGLGNGAFGPATPVAAGSVSTRFPVGDFNGDGRADVVANDGNFPAVFLSDTFGFLQKGDPIRPLGVSIVGDFDGDGRLDLAGPGVLYLGNGDGSFVTPRYLPTGYASRLTVLDVSKDGKPDLAWMSPNSALGTMLGDGDGGFGPPVMTAFLVPNFDGVFADVTGDGIPDAVVTASAFPPATLYVLPGDGAGRFGAPIVTTVGVQQQISRPVVADFDGDGHADAAFRLTDQLVVLFGDGTGRFPRSKPPRPVPFGELSVSDLNGDGKPDLVLVSPGGDIGDRLVTLVNDGTGGFSTGVDLALSPSLYAPSLRVIDADGDGKPDLLATSYGLVTFRKGDGAGGFGPPVDTPAPAAWYLVAADFDGDGIVDVLTGSNSTTALKGRGDGRFDVTGTYPFPFGLVTAADVTGDGRPDVLGMDYASSWLVPNTTCLPRRLQLDAWPLSCGTAGVPFATQPTVRVFDDAGNPLPCEAGSVVASLVPGGTPGAALVGTKSVPLAAGAAHFTDLSVDKGGSGYRVRFDLPGTRPAATAEFSQSLPAPAITGPAQVCSGSPARFEAPDADGWTWSLDGGVVGTSRVLTLSAVSPGPHTLALAIAGGACTASASRSLSVAGAIPAPAASSNSPVPFGGALQLHASTVPGATFRWTGPNGFASAAQHPVIPFAKAEDSGRYRVVATVGTCESDASTTDVVVLSPTCTGCAKPSFSPAIAALPVAGGFQSVALADVDGDGVADLLTAQNDGYGTISFLKGDGRGGFAPPVESKVHFSAGPELAIADLDGNGLPDAVTASYGVYVSLQTAPGRFGAATSTTGGSGAALALADVNGDGILDILSAESGGGGFGLPYLPGRVAVLLGNGAGGFGPPAYVPVEFDPSALLARDLNGDGKVDLLVANRVSENVSVFFGDGTGAFALQGTLAVSGPPVALAAADVTGDAAADLVVGVSGANQAAVIFEGSASGNFTFVRSLPILLDTRLLLADLDGDGRPDIVTLAGGVVRVWLGRGAALFSPPTSSNVPGAHNVLTVGDFNGDGVVDAVVGLGASYNPPVRIGLMAGDGRGGFSQMPALETSPPLVAAVTVADMNGDARPDLLSIGPPGLELFLADPTGGYAPGAVLAPVPSFTVDSLSVADVTGDGIPDVIEIDGYGGKLHVLRGLGNGLVGPPVVTTVGRSIAILAIGDFDGDGRMDLLVGPRLGDYIPPVSILLADGLGGFRSPIDIPGFVQASGAAIGDFDGDGKLDVVLADESENRRISVYPWNGTGFSTPVHTPLSGYPKTLAIGDFDGNGKLDVVLGITPTSYLPDQAQLYFLPGNGAGGFGPTRAVGSELGRRALVAADLNGDGRLDLAAILQDAKTIAIYMGDGQGGFPASAEFASGDVGGALTVADLDHDGRQDLLFAQPYPFVARTLLNSNCVPSRLGVTANPSCVTAGQPFGLDVGIFDDGGNLIACDSGTMSAVLVPGTGAAGAVLDGTTSVAAASGVAHFADLALDRDGRRYRIEFSHPLASSARSAPFSVGALAAPAIAGPPQLCAGTSIYAAPAGFDTYTWSVDGTTISSARTLTPAFLAAGSHTLGLTVTRDRCPATASVAISNAPPALTALSPNHGVSQGGTLVTLSAACVAPAATVAFGGVLADPWVAPGLPPLQVFTGAHVPAVVDAVVTNPDGQVATLPGSYTYECDTRPPTVSNNGPLCAGSSLTLRGPFFPGATYAWTGPNGFSANTRFVTIPSATVAHAGVYTVTVGNVSGCTLPPATTTVVVNPRPSAVISAPSSVIAGSTGNTASVPDAGPGATYNWYVTSGNATITSSNTQRSITFDAGASGSLILNAYVFTGVCADYAAVTIPITPRPTALGFLAPCRLLDTRLPDGPAGGPALAAGVVRNFPLAGRCGIPADAVAIAVNMTVTAPTSAGALRVYAGGAPVPGTTNLWFRAGQTRAGSSIVALGPDGSADVVSTQASGTAHVILDVSGYFR